MIDYIYVQLHIDILYTQPQKYIVKMMSCSDPPTLETARSRPPS